MLFYDFAMKTLLKSTFTLISAMATAVCSYATENPVRWLRDSLPDSWEYVSQYSQKLPTEDDWWKTFGDRNLDSLISMAERENFNAGAAVSRIEMARKTLDAAKSAYFPTIDLSASWTKGQNSGATSKAVTPPSGYDYFSLGASAQWEIDIFGKITQNIKVSKASYEATRAEYDGLMVSLAANVAKAYITLRSAQRELEVAKSHLAEQEKVLAIVEARFKAGIASKLEVTQSKTVVATTKASIPSLEAMIESSINSLALLTARYPSDIHDWLSSTSAEMQIIYGAQLGVPADLLRRRPDIIEAEAVLARNAAQLGVAKKEFLPTLSITGSIATQAHDASNLFGKNSLYWEIRPSLDWTLFDGLARNYKTAEARSQLEAAVYSYNYTVMNAVIEVQNATTTYKSSISTYDLMANAVEESKESLSLAVELYKKGLTPFSNVVDAQIRYLENQDSQIAARKNALSAVVSLYQALGGGWNAE